jgi:hypothetical protein
MPLTNTHFVAKHQALWPSIRAGKNKIALMSENTPPTAMPSNRNGSEINQTIGNKINANIASGHESTNKMHHARKKIKVFMAD